MRHWVVLVACSLTLPPALAAQEEPPPAYYDEKEKKPAGGGVSVRFSGELKAHYRVMVTVTSMLTPVGEAPDWEGLRAAVCKWSPPEDGTVPTWNGEPYQ